MDYNNDERYWNINLLNKWFAISSILFLFSFMWMFYDDNDDVDGSDIFYGVGVSFALTENLDLRLDYTRFDVEFDRDEIGILAEIDNFDTKVDYASLGIQYTF